MASQLLDGATKAFGLPAAGAIFAALAGQVYLWSFGPYGWTQKEPICPQIETCVVVAGLDGDVSYGFGAGGNVFGIDLNDDVTERLVSRLEVASGASHDTTTFIKYTREVTLPEAGDARQQEEFFESLARAREIGVTSRARLVVMGRVVGDDVIIWFVDPNGSDAPHQADYSMTAPNAQQNLAASYSAALVQVAQGERTRTQAAAERERLAQQNQRELERAEQRQRQIQEQQARTQAAANVPPQQPTGPPARAATPPPPVAQSGAPGMRAPPPSQTTTASSAGGTRTSPSQAATGSSGARTAPQTQTPQQQPQPARPTPTATPTPTPPSNTPPTAVTMPNGPFVYTCTDDRILRVVFDSEDRTATITQYGRAPTRLNLATGGPTFRFARSGYELVGTTTEVRWRIGSGDPMVCSRRSW